MLNEKKETKKTEKELPEDASEKKKVLRKMIVWSELLRPRFDEGLE